MKKQETEKVRKNEADFSLLVAGTSYLAFALMFILKAFYSRELILNTGWFKMTFWLTFPVAITIYNFYCMISMIRYWLETAENDTFHFHNYLLSFTISGGLTYLIISDAILGGKDMICNLALGSCLSSLITTTIILFLRVKQKL